MRIYGTFTCISCDQPIDRLDDDYVYVHNAKDPPHDFPFHRRCFFERWELAGGTVPETYKAKE